VQIVKLNPISLKSGKNQTKKNVVLIRPHMLIPTFSFTGLTTPPLGLAYLASAVESIGHNVIIIDAVGEGIDNYAPYQQDYLLHGLSTDDILRRIPNNTDVIGFSCMFSHEFPVYKELINSVKNTFPNSLVVAGGEHVTGLPELSLRECKGLDVIVLGEGEEIFNELLSSYDVRNLSLLSGIAYKEENGDVKVNQRRARISDINSIKSPAWHLVPLKNYWERGKGYGVDLGKGIPMLASRGCPYQCTFCSNPLMWTTRWVARSPRLVLDEMIDYNNRYGVTNFDFYDLTAIVKKAWIIEFCQLIIESNYKFTYQLPSGTRSEAIDTEVAKLLYKSGCRNMTYAPESGSIKTLTRIKKKIKIKSMLSSIKGCHKAGLSIKANIIVGFPDETIKDLLINYIFILRMALVGMHDVTVQPYSAYPGTELFDELRNKGKIKELDEEYFHELAAYSDLTKSISWSDYLTKREILLFRSLSMVSFYILSFSIRPWRLIKLIYNLSNKTQETRLDRALSDIIYRKSGKNNMIKIQPPYI